MILHLGLGFAVLFFAAVSAYLWYRVDKAHSSLNRQYRKIESLRQEQIQRSCNLERRTSQLETGVDQLNNYAGHVDRGLSHVLDRLDHIEENSSAEENAEADFQYGYSHARQQIGRASCRERV